MDLKQIFSSNNQEFCCQIELNLYDSPECKELATQIKAQRHLKILSQNSINNCIEIHLCEDNYAGWLPIDQIQYLILAETPYKPNILSRHDIEKKISEIIDFAKKAMEQSNYYLWGGTIGPNYDCSGLIQTAFANSGIWLPRDSYQQADFTKSIAKEDLQPGDLIFFAKNNKVDHVALSLENGYYIHSSGKEIGRNGIGIDQLSENGDQVSIAYLKRFWGCGRVTSSLV